MDRITTLFEKTVKRLTPLKKLKVKTLDEVTLESVEKLEESLFANLTFLKTKMKRAEFRKVISSLKQSSVKKTKIRKRRRRAFQ